MKKIVIFISFIFLLSSCATTSSRNTSELVRFIIDGGSYGTHYDAKYFVVLDEDTEKRSDANTILKYVSNLLDYRGIHETSLVEEADYLIIVSYTDSIQSPSEQIFQLMGVSKRVYMALGEARPSWAAISKHVGVPKHTNIMLPMGYVRSKC